jgi:PAS domain-containing protein
MWSTQATIHNGTDRGMPALFDCRHSGCGVKEKQEVALERDGQNLQLLIDAIVDYAIYMIGTDGRVLSWNTGAARMKGYTREEIIGKPFLQLLYA